MHYKTEIHRKVVYAFIAIQNPKQVPKMWFYGTQHISAATPIEKIHYKTEIQRKFVYAFVEIQKPKHRAKARLVIFCKPVYFCSTPNRNDAWKNWVSPKKYVYVFVEIQNPKQVPKMWFYVSQHISAANPIRFTDKFVYAFVEIQKPPTGVQNVIFCNPAYLCSNPNRKDSL